MNLLAFAIVFIFLPIPFAHIALHSFLRFWRGHRLSWLTFCAALWIIALPLAANIICPVVFHPSVFFQIIYWAAIVSAAVIIIWAIAALGARRYFLYEVVSPSGKHNRVQKGPYRFLPHPAYFSYFVIIVAAYLLTGTAAILAVLIEYAILIPIVAMLENRELKKRLK